MNFVNLYLYQYGKRRNVGGVREEPQTLVSFKTKNICPLLFLPYGRGGGIYLLNETSACGRDTSNIQSRIQNPRMTKYTFNFGASTRICDILGKYKPG